MQQIQIDHITLQTLATAVQVTSQQFVRKGDDLLGRILVSWRDLRAHHDIVGGIDQRFAEETF